MSQLSKSVGCKALEVSRLKDRCIRLTGSNEQLRSENEGLRQMIVDIKADLRKMEQEATCVEGDAQQLIKSLAAAQQRATRKATECTALRDRCEVEGTQHPGRNLCCGVVSRRRPFDVQPHTPRGVAD